MEGGGGGRKVKTLPFDDFSTRERERGKGDDNFKLNVFYYAQNIS